MYETKCKVCGGNYHWAWEDAFNKFGFNDGDGQVMTWKVDEILTEAGYLVNREHWGFHNVIITSIKKDGKELLPMDDQGFNLGYDNPRYYLPQEIIDILDKVEGDT